MNEKKKIAAVIPAYNESRNIKNTLLKVKNFADIIIVVDDGSEDDTYEIANNSIESYEEENIYILKHDYNLGKGAALKTGCEAAKKLKADVMICLDADEQHKPEDIPRFIEKIDTGNKIVFGSRAIGKGMPLASFVGNKFLSAAICKLFKIYINDTQSGYKAFTKEAYEKIKWESPDYSVETEIIINAAKHKLDFEEIDIDVIYNDNYKGTTPVHGMQIFIKILKWKFL